MRDLLGNALPQPNLQIFKTYAVLVAVLRLYVYLIRALLYITQVKVSQLKPEHWL
ncbi:hypothetical protein GXM_00113 [Nostoc sphaeroides CCNUC1]|uniref:Uncharacterized protein n=1 Tax=Nostoc sphaeroides CCNUC1 TaxID=2653204 RepID=A0A5P8VQM3_9NOSO|nr:hypothetical protein GXM_00113 [Nostoc sphaeroides CCNUC1]